MSDDETAKTTMTAWQAHCLALHNQRMADPGYAAALKARSEAFIARCAAEARPGRCWSCDAALPDEADAAEENKLCDACEEECR